MTKSATPLSFPSRVDAWLCAVLAAAALVVVLAIVATALQAPLWQTALVAVIAVPAGVALPAWMLLSTRYVIDGQTLHVRCCPFCWQVCVQDIRSIAPSQSALSAPALSLHRLRIRYGRRSELLVSPKDRHNFVRTLKTANPAISLHGFDS